MPIKWEYKTFRREFTPVDRGDRFWGAAWDLLEVWLNELGSEGWIAGDTEVYPRGATRLGMPEILEYAVTCRRRLYPPPPDFGVDPSQAAY
jgi:hypothetical protein